ncbi:MAG: alpha/beta hydrolase family protein [Actinobacteria bacterium]|nr:alpha/beta hydrolase family protein [Actinomycetota bacterium]
MLFDVAAILTSVTLGPVAEAFGVHEVDTYAVVHTLSIPDAPPLPFIGPEPAAGDPTDQVQGTGQLQQLALLPARSIKGWVQANPEVIAQLLASPPPAHDVTVWWGALDFNSKLSLRNATPELVGNLDGIPYSVRDLANRTVLDTTMKALEHTIATETGRTVIENAKQQLHMLDAIDEALGAESADDRTLLSLDVTGQGRAAIVVGDLRTADYVSYLVPGMFFTIENQMGDWVDAAARLHDEEASWLALLGPGAGTGASDAPTVATVAWIGYHTPNLTNVGGIENAYEGRDALASAIEGLQSLRSGDEPYVSVIAHSYGSTAALMALTDYDFQVDALALVGSPGSPAKSVAELHVRDGNVFVGEAAWDPIPNSSYFGSDPGAQSYGAKPMAVSGGTDPLTKLQLGASLGHNEYFAPGSESMRNFALIAIGQGQYVTH